MLLAVLAPISIVAGNIYRARFWPKDSGPMDLALAMSGAGALLLAGGLLLTSRASFADIQPESSGGLALGGLDLSRRADLGGHEMARRECSPGTPARLRLPADSDSRTIRVLDR